MQLRTSLTLPNPSLYNLPYKELWWTFSWKTFFKQACIFRTWDLQLGESHPQITFPIALVPSSYFLFDLPIISLIPTNHFSKFAPSPALNTHPKLYFSRISFCSAFYSWFSLWISLIGTSDSHATAWTLCSLKISCVALTFPEAIWANI